MLALDRLLTLNRFFRNGNVAILPRTLLGFLPIYLARIFCPTVAVSATK
jgi:hypothetical protein